jgi:hypothetical protein
MHFLAIMLQSIIYSTTIYMTKKKYTFFLFDLDLLLEKSLEYFVDYSQLNEYTCAEFMFDI